MILLSLYFLGAFQKITKTRTAQLWGSSHEYTKYLVTLIKKK